MQQKIGIAALPAIMDGMKWLPLFCLLLLPFAAFAEDAQPAVKPLGQTATPNVIIVDGKKFFSLGNARRFTGSTNSPRALGVMHHPRPQGITIRPHRNLPAPSYPASATESASPDSRDQVLSIFTPDEKKPSPVPPTK